MTSEPMRVWASAEAAERWQRSAAQRRQAVGAVTDLMLDAVGLQAGFRVLDLAAGTGDTSILAAQRVGPQGAVLAVDISAAMLEAAAEAARAAGLDNVETLTSDVSELDVPARSFDAAISRFGLMFLTDITEGLRRIRAALKPGARLAAIVWSAEARNPYLTVPMAVAEAFGRGSDTGSLAGRAFSLSSPAVFQGALEQAGFGEVRMQTVATPRAFDSVDGAVESIRLNSPVMRELASSLDAATQQRLDGELRQRLQAFADRDGQCVLPGEALLAIATA
jgi:ubiquinone/menaquinone biosynthesis C-methylase UbiE